MPVFYKKIDFFCVFFRNYLFLKLFFIFISTNYFGAWLFIMKNMFIK